MCIGNRQVSEHAILGRMLRELLSGERGARVAISYLSVGIGNILIYLSTLSILHEMLHVNVYISSVVGFMAAVSASFFLNRNLTFPGQADLSQFIMYFGILFMMMVMNQVVLYLTIEMFGWHYLVGQLVAISILTPTTFVLSYVLVFSTSKAGSS